MEKNRVPDLYFMILSVRPKASMNPYSEDRILSKTFTFRYNEKH